MPSLKVSVNPEAKSAFESYEGPTPPVGNGYEGVIKNVRVKLGKDSGNPYLNVLVEHDTKDANRKQYNGAPQWVRVMFGEHDETQARLAAFVKAITGKANKEANIVDTDVDARSGTGSIVKTIDGVKPDGKRVKFDIREEAAQGGYDARLSADFIRRVIDAPVEAGSDEAEDQVDEEDIEVEDDEAAEGDELTREEREAELKKEALADLRAAAKEAEIDIKGLKKAEIIEAILDWEFEGAEDEEDGDEEDEEELELEEGDESEEEEEADEEDEEDGDDPEAEIRAELADLDRAALKARLKESAADKKVFKSTTDDDLRDWIVDAELGEPPF